MEVATSRSSGPNFKEAIGNSTAHSYRPDTSNWSETRRLTEHAGTDTEPVLATTPDGKVWMAWQRWSDGQADILLAPLDEAASAAEGWR